MTQESITNQPQRYGLPEISVAPMMDWTDRHCRYFHRLLAPNVRLYTEMVTTGAILYGDKDRFLRFDEAEHPLALQLGGSDPKALALSAKEGERYGYDEINLNCGCPSDRVQSGRFGACLMKEPEHVAACVESMVEAVDNIPVTVKCRIGIDDLDSFEFLDKFVDKVADKGCRTFIIHARKAWLSGLSPKQNREVPLLDYERVKRIKAKYPHLRIILNGGISSMEILKEALAGLDGVMIGREAYQNPLFLQDIEAEIFGNRTLRGREEAALSMIPYAQTQAERYGTPVKSVTRHMMGLFQGLPGAKAWRQALSTLPYENEPQADIIEEALNLCLTRAREAA
ncbi:MAG: tRNA dihydrouridine(20/20a) synthase DusA [Alphaproteobacteria bacterium]|nr:tRNA dihydrouridine(20/20a) synthase DusA [Alphaproteobacteria bacterium]